MTTKHLRILMMDDDAEDLIIIKKMLHHLKGGRTFHVETSANYEAALEMLPAGGYDACLLDYQLKDRSGLDFLREAKRMGNSVPIIFLTGHGDYEVDLEAMQLGAADFLNKNKVDATVLERSIRYAIERKKSEEALRKSESQLRESQKLEAIGQLSAGIAHDFNNILNVVSGNAELLLSEATLQDDLREEAEEIQKAVLRGTQLTRQLLMFGRRDVSQPVPLSLNRTTSEIMKMLGRLIGEDVELIIKGDPGLRSIKADPIHIQQVLMNLCSNARDAMPKGGQLLIETRNMIFEEDFLKEKVLVPAGNYVLLSVNDTGIGMDEETQTHIFEPFFTTKETGKGTGLGLATVYGIVKKSDGHIWVYSEIGKGTTFNLLFPAIEVGEERVVEPHSRLVAGGTETVLLVEDEESLRTIMSRTLQKKGYRVLQAADGEDGLAQALKHLKEIDLLLTDTVMPRMSGKALADKVREVRLNMKIIFMSGYPREVLSKQGIVDSGIQLIQKPFSSETLLLKVREVLDGLF